MAFRKMCSAFFVSCIIALCYSFSFIAYDHVIAESFLISSRNDFMILFSLCALVAVILSLFLYLLFSLLDSTITAIPKTTKTKSYTPVSLLKYILLISTCWFPYFIIRFPGNLDPDTYWQLLQFYNFAERSDHHPWFDTCVFGAFWKIGDLAGSNQWSLLIYAFLQILLTAAAMSVFFFYVKEKIPEWLFCLLFIFCCLFPPFPMFAQTMTKDSLHGPFFVLYFIIIYYSSKGISKIQRLPD